MSDQFSSQSTDSFFELLKLANCSMLVTTYQAGQVVIIRAQDKGINTHFMAFDRPMGIARKINEFSIDTAIAHLTGALGKPVWVLLHQNCDWRWQKIGDKSIWYPTAHLFRQTKANKWLDVIQCIDNEIEKRYSK